jgi:hypothetical protein
LGAVVSAVSAASATGEKYFCTIGSLGIFMENIGRFWEFVQGAMGKKGKIVHEKLLYAVRKSRHREKLLYRVWFIIHFEKLLYFV